MKITFHLIRGFGLSLNFPRMTGTIFYGQIGPITFSYGKQLKVDPKQAAKTLGLAFEDHRQH